MGLISSICLKGLNCHQRSFRPRGNLQFFNIKIVFRIKSFVVLMYQNNRETVTALTGKSYVTQFPKINMFANIGIKVRGLVPEAPRLFSAPLQKF